MVGPRSSFPKYRYTKGPFRRAVPYQRYVPKKRHYSKKALKHTEPTNFIGNTPAMPVKFFTGLRYSESVKLTATAATATAYVVTANGLFDPNITGTGHQPMGFDQIMLWYEHYHVTKAKITVNFAANSSTQYCVVGIAIAPDATPVTDFRALIENGLLVRKWLAPQPNNSRSLCSLSIECDIAKINGTKSILYEDDFRGDVGANPAEQSYFHIFIYDPFDLTGTPQVDVDYLVEYKALFTEPRKLALS